MQIVPTFTDEEIISVNPAETPFDLIPQALEKIECVADIIESMNYDHKSRPFCEMNTPSVYALGTIIKDAAKDIIHLNLMATDQLFKVVKERDELAEKLKVHPSKVSGIKVGGGDADAV